MTSAIPYLRSTQAIRDRCGQLFDLALQDRLEHFRVDLDRLDAAANYVLRVIQTHYPDLQVPFHSRWRHFAVGGIDRVGQLEHQMAGLSPIEQARAKFDLAITSVLLDAGAGPDWQYVEPGTDQVLRRSEGLAVASFYLFLEGKLSSHPAHPLQADAIGLQALTAEHLAESFQVSDRHPLVGVSGRAELLQKLGQTLYDQPLFFPAPAAQPPRPGHLVDYLASQAIAGELAAHQVLTAVLEGLSQIWPGRVTIEGVNLGDVWPHTALPQGPTGLVPFHKLSQWLTYSLLEPLQDLGLNITHLDQLTGLAEYRNGGLCLDLGLLQPKQDRILTDTHLPSSEVIVEWRALTLILLDRLATTIRHQLHQDALTFPLAKVLEGGTWAAGRQIAAELRPGGPPPVAIVSDGTVF